MLIFAIFANFNFFIFWDFHGKFTLGNVIVYTIIGILLFLLGIKVIADGVRQKKAWKIIIGIFLTGIFWGLIIWGIIFFKNRNKTSPDQQINSSRSVRSSKKTSSRNKTTKS